MVFLKDQIISQLQVRNKTLETELKQCHELIESLRIQIADLGAQVIEMQGNAARGEYNTGKRVLKKLLKNQKDLKVHKKWV